MATVPVSEQAQDGAIAITPAATAAVPQENASAPGAENATPKAPVKRRIRRIIKKPTDATSDEAKTDPSATQADMKPAFPKTPIAAAGTKQTPVSTSAALKQPIPAEKKTTAPSPIATKQPVLTEGKTTASAAPKQPISGPKTTSPKQPESTEKTTASAKAEATKAPAAQSSSNGQSGTRRFNFFFNLLGLGASVALSKLTNDGHHHGHDNDHDDYDGDNDNDDGDNQDHGHDHNQEEKGYNASNNKAISSAAGNLITGTQSTKPVNRSQDTKAGGPTVRVAPVASSPEPNEKKPIDAATGAGLLLGVGLTDIIVKFINIVFPLFFLGMSPSPCIEFADFRKVSGSFISFRSVNRKMQSFHKMSLLRRRLLLLSGL